MKITLQQAENSELEIIIRGNIADPVVARLIEAVNGCERRDVLMLCREEREYPTHAADISRIEAIDGKTTAFVKNQPYEVKFKLYQLADMLAKNRFVQISKSCLVNVEHIESIEVEFSGNYVAFLKDGKTRLTISRKYMKSFREYIMEGKKYE